MDIISADSQNDRIQAGTGYPQDDCDSNQRITQQQIAETNTEVSAKEWAFIGKTLKNYYEENQTNPKAAGYAHQMYNLYNFSFDEVNKEPRNWAGRFTRAALLFAANDTVQRKDFWQSPPNTYIGMFVTTACFTANLVGQALYDCGTARAGEHHFKEHIIPIFHKYIKAEFLSVVEHSCPKELRKNLISKIQEIRKEHEQLIINAVIPGFDNVCEISIAARKKAQITVPEKVKKIRENTFNTVLKELSQEEKILNITEMGCLKKLENDGSNRYECK